MAYKPNNVLEFRGVVEKALRDRYGKELPWPLKDVDRETGKSYMVYRTFQSGKDCYQWGTLFRIDGEESRKNEYKWFMPPRMSQAVFFRKITADGKVIRIASRDCETVISDPVARESGLDHLPLEEAVRRIVNA